MAYAILVADDKPSMREMLASAFGEHGFEVSQASNGLDAIAMLRESNFDLVIADLNMPGENGIGVLRAAKEISPDIKVICLALAPPRPLIYLSGTTFAEYLFSATADSSLCDILCRF